METKSKIDKYNSALYRIMQSKKKLALRNYRVSDVSQDGWWRFDDRYSLLNPPRMGIKNELQVIDKTMNKIVECVIQNDPINYEVCDLIK